MKSGRSQHRIITMTFLPVGGYRMGLLPEGFMFFVFLTCAATLAF
jgi:hypothetical protein